MSQVQMQSFGDLVPDDPMETEAERRAGQTDDIDIDLDFVEESQHDVEDQYMSEDVDAFNNQEAGIVQAEDTYNDDEMADDGRDEQDIVYEASIQDEELHDAEEVSAVQPDEDDEIIDDVDGEPLPTPLSASPVHEVHQLQQSTGHEGPVEHVRTDKALRFGQEQAADQPQLQTYSGDEEGTIHSHQNQESFTERADTYTTSQVETQEQEQRERDDGTLEAHTNVENDKQQQSYGEAPVHADVSAQVPLQHTIPPVIDTKEDVGFRTDDKNIIAHGGEALASHDQSDLGEKLQTEPLVEQPPDETKPVGQDEVSSEAIARVHPVLVLYQGTEISLFRPTDEDRDFLLEDEGLADASLADLLEATRPVLGDDVSEQELVVHVNDLDLRIYESAHDTLNFTMSQLIDIYLELQQRDGFVRPPALRLSLFTRPSFSHRLATLRDALEEGKSLLQVRLVANVQEEEQHDPATEHDPDGALVPAETITPGQDSEGNRTTIFESDAPDVLVISAVHKDLMEKSEVLTAGVEHDAKSGTHAATKNHKKDKSSNNTETSLPSEEVYSQQAEPHDANSALQDEMKVQHGQEPDLPDDQEEIIDYDERPIDPVSSSASSTIRGDVASSNQLASPSDPPGAIKEEADPDTATSSITWDGPLSGPASRPLDRNEETDDPKTATNGSEEVAKYSDRNHDDHLDFHTSVDGEQLLEHEAQSNTVDGSRTGTPIHSDDFANNDEVKQALEGHREYPVEEPSESFQQEDLDPVNEKDLSKGPADLEYNDQDETNEQSDLPQEQGDEHIETHHDSIQSSVDVVEELGATAVEEDDVNDTKASEDPDVQALLHDAVSHEDHDDFTIEDEGEDADYDSASANLDDALLPSSGSLKRPRGHPNADDTIAQDSQKTKRTRSG